MTETPQVVDHGEAGLLETMVEGERAELVYRRRANRLILLHTEVPESIGGRGIGGALVEAAVEKAIREGLVLVPICPYASLWLKRHPDVAQKLVIDWPSQEG